MKKQHLFFSVTLLLSLVACNQPGDNGLLSLYDANARFVSVGYGQDINGDNEWSALATYRHKKNGEAPYVEVGQFFDVLNSTFHQGVDFETMTAFRLDKYDSSIKKIAEHKYGIFSESTLGAVIDAQENTLTVNRFDYVFAQPDLFNGSIRNDIASPSNSRISLVHGNYRSTYFGTFKEEVYDLDDYNMDVAEIDNKIYMPAQLLSNFILRGTGADLVYNGNDFFISSSVGSDSTSIYTAGSYRSSNNTFEIEHTLYSPVTPLEGEAHRYVGNVPVEEGQETLYGIFSLDKEGHGYFFKAGSADAASSEAPDYKLDWQEVNNDIYLTMYLKNTTGGFAEFGHIMRISSNETFYNKKVRSKELSEFNYQLLRFQIDNYYGLKEEFKARHGFKDFDSFVTEKGLKEKLLSTDTKTYDEGLCQFLMGYVDDGHTKYTDCSIFSGIEAKPSALVDTYMGPRRGSLLSKHDEYVAYRQSVLGEGVEPLGLFTEGETAVIRFDAFMHPLPLISDPGDSIDMLDMATIIQGSSPFGFMKAFKELESHDEIKNVVLDLTCNGGGMVLTLPFLAAYFTKNPTIYLKDNLGGVVREFHYEIDLNCDGIYNGVGDCYADKYHFYILTSDFSFSCASAFPTMAHIAGVDIIGVKCAGGACNVAGFTDACGSIYTLSAPQQIGYLDEDGNFVNDDAGIPVTHELAKENWYDLAKLNEAVKGFSGN